MPSNAGYCVELHLSHTGLVAVNCWDNCKVTIKKNSLPPRLSLSLNRSTIMELELLREEVLSYERDPLHKITPKHIALRMACVVKFGSEEVIKIVNEVCQQLWEERLCYCANYVSLPLAPESDVAKKSTSAPVKRAKPKKTSATHRRGYRSSIHRR